MPYRRDTKQPFALRPTDVHSRHISSMASDVAHKLQDSEVRGTGKTLYIVFQSIGNSRVQTAAVTPQTLKYHGDIGFKLESRGGGYSLSPLGRNNAAMKKLTKSLAEALKQRDVLVAESEQSSRDAFPKRGMGRTRSRSRF